MHPYQTGGQPLVPVTFLSQEPATESHPGAKTAHIELSTYTSTFLPQLCEEPWEP